MEQPYSLTVTSNYAIPSGVKNINADSRRGSIRLTLPQMATFFTDNIKSSQNSFEIWIFDYAGYAATNNITIVAAEGDFFANTADAIALGGAAVITELTISVGYGGYKLVAQGGTNSTKSGGKWGSLAIS